MKCVPDFKEMPRYDDKIEVIMGPSSSFTLTTSIYIFLWNVKLAYSYRNLRVSLCKLIIGCGIRLESISAGLSHLKAPPQLTPNAIENDLVTPIISNVGFGGMAKAFPAAQVTSQDNELLDSKSEVSKIRTNIISNGN
uniref:Uncharacterized protein n=1 Tax=Glossina austeni TaxID=7395 RepID=A0A1A9VFD2_GLOAU